MKFKLAFISAIALVFIAVPLIHTEAALKTSVPKRTPSNLLTNLIGSWTFDGKDCGASYCVDKSGSGFTATSTLVKRSLGKVGQALGFNVSSPPTWNQGLVGWWNMDTNRLMGTSLSDLSGYANTGTLSGTTIPSIIGGKIGQALSFDGSTSYIDVPSSDSLNIGNSPMTMAAWVYWKSSTDTYNTLIERYGDGGLNGYTLMLTSGQKIAAYFDPNSGSCNSDALGGTVSFNQWHHIAAVSTGSNIIVYLDGVQDSTKVAACSMSQSTTVLRLGHARVTANRYFNGYMDDVRIYNRALSAEEISGLFSGPSYLSISPTTNLNNFTLSSTQGVTLGTWVKFASSTGNQILMRKSDTATSSNSYELKSNGTNFQLQIGTTTSVTITGTTAIKPYRWYYVAGTADSSNMKLYVNGAQEASATVAGTAITSVSPTVNNWGNTLFFGMDDSPSNLLVGWLDDPKIYSRALSATEVKQTYDQGGRSLTTAATRPTRSNLLTNLVGRWTFDGKDCGATYCVDKSGSANTGLLTGASKAPGKIGQALRLNGINDKVAVTQSNTINSFSALSASLWVKYSKIAGMQRIIRKSDGASGNNNYQIDSDGANFRFHIGTTASTTITGTTTIKPDRWFHVAGVYDGSNMYLYVNGAQEATSAKTGTVSTGTTNNLFFGTTESSDTYLNGHLDEIKLYSRALSASEVYQLYRQRL